MMNSVYPGSFDPVTNGHLDVIKRASKISDTLYVAVLQNYSKKSRFTIEERVEMLEESIKGLDNVKIITFSGLLVHLFKKLDIHAIIKGLRAVSDFEYELQMAQINRSMDPKAETIFVMASPKYNFISSSMIKEIHALGGDISEYVPKCVLKKLKQEEK